MTRKNLKDQEAKANKPNLLATILIILSGLILYLDKIFVLLNIELENTHGYEATPEFVWSLAQTISPILIMIGFYLKPFKEALLVPLFCYTIQLYFVLDSSLTIDRALTWIYVSGTVLINIILVIAIKKYLTRKQKLQALKTGVMKEIIKTDDKLINPEESEQPQKN